MTILLVEGQEQHASYVHAPARIYAGVVILSLVWVRMAVRFQLSGQHLEATTGTCLRLPLSGSGIRSEMMESCSYPNQQHFAPTKVILSCSWRPGVLVVSAGLETAEGCAREEFVETGNQKELQAVSDCIRNSVLTKA